MLQVARVASGFLATAATVVQSLREARLENEIMNSRNGDLPTAASVSAPSPATVTPGQRENDVDDAALNGLMNVLQGLHDCSI